nr:DC-STAMP domain-containing protein 2 [Drosophila bipectinata]
MEDYCYEVVNSDDGNESQDLDTDRCVRSFDVTKEGNERYSRNLRDCSPEGEPPIYPIESKDETRKKEVPECPPKDSEIKAPWDCRDNVMFYVIAGYIVGVLIVQIWYYRNPQKACRDLNAKWLFLVVIGLGLLLMVLTRPGRCILALCLPTLVHYRVLVISCALLVALSGPVTNFIFNIAILGHSLTCEGKLLFVALEKMHRVMAEPSYPVQESFQGTLSAISQIINKLDKILVRMELPIADIQATYRTGIEWLDLQHDFFNYKMGSPFNRCLAAGFLVEKQLNSQSEESNKEDHFSWFCKDLESLTSFFDKNLLLQEELMEDIFRRLHIIFVKLRFIFMATITFEHNTDWSTVGSICDKDLGLHQEIYKYMDWQRRKLFLVYSIIYVIIFILIFNLILKATSFRFRYLASKDYNNVYITRDFKIYEEQQFESLEVKALPLRSFEENKYVEINSMRLLPEEFDSLKHSRVFLVIMGIQLFSICFLDYSLYVLIKMMSHYSKVSKIVPDYHRLAIKGKGTIVHLLRSIVNAFEPRYFDVDEHKCLIIPRKPKYLFYCFIFILYILAWVLVFLEPYELRKRHRIMAYFYPEQAQRRAIALYNTILRERDDLIRSSRQRARCLNSYSDKSPSFVLLCASWMSSLNTWCSNGCRGYFIGKTCTICHRPLQRFNYVSCSLPKCKGIYCQACFLESSDLCILCSSESNESEVSEIGFSESEDLEPDYCKADDNADRDDRDKKA